MALPPEFLDELRARTPLSAVIGRRVKLSKSGRNWKGCCPFHGEKSPSFYVYDDHFHCFGCGAHGDCISFQMQSSGASFPEAVESLPRKPGSKSRKPPLPRPAPSRSALTCTTSWITRRPASCAGCMHPRARPPWPTCAAAA